MDLKKTVAQRLVELLRLTTDELGAQLTLSRGIAAPHPAAEILLEPLPDRIREEIIEAELESGAISK